MWRKVSLTLVLFSLTCLTGFSQVPTQTVFPFPQIAVGQLGSGNEFRTQIILSNPTNRDATGSLDFLDDDGRDITLDVYSLRTGERRAVTGVLSFRIQAGVTTVWELSSSGPVRAGSSIVSTAPRDGGNGVPISGTAAYGIYDRSGTIRSLAGVGASGFVTDAFIPVLEDPSRALNTGVAFTTTRPTNITFTLLDDNGNVIATAGPTRYGDGIHRSLFYNDIFGRGPSSGLVIRSLRITSDNPIAVIAVQVIGETLTSFPVVAISDITHKAGAVDQTFEGLLQKRHPNRSLNGPVME